MTNYIDSSIIFFRFHPKRSKQEVPRGRLLIQLYTVIVARGTDQIERIEDNEMLRGYYEKQDSWSKQFPEVSTIPAEENFIMFYLLSLLQTGKSYPAIRSSVFAIKYFHEIVGHHDPCNSELINYVLESIRRIYCHTPNKKKPFIRNYSTHYTDPQAKII